MFSRLLVISSLLMVQNAMARPLQDVEAKASWLPIVDLTGSEHAKLRAAFVATSKYRAERPSFFQMLCTSSWLEAFDGNIRDVLSTVNGTGRLRYDFINHVHTYYAEFSNQDSWDDGLHLQGADRIVLVFELQDKELTSKILNFSVKLLNSDG